MTISAGTPVEVDSAVSDSLESAMISASQILAIFNDPVSTLSARVLDITTSTKTIDTVNAQQTIEAYGSAIDIFGLIRFSATKFLSVKAGGGAADTIAQVLNVSGTTVTGATSLTLTDPANPSSVILRGLTSTTALLAYQGGFAGTGVRVRVLSIDGSDNITEGSALLANDTGADDIFDVELFSATSAMLAIQDSSDSDFLKAQLLSISGSTISKVGGVQTLNGSDSGDQTSTALAAISSTQMVVGYAGTGSDDLTCHVVTLSGSTLTPGVALDIPSGQHGWPQRAIKTNATTVLFAGSTSTINRTTQVIKDGTTLSYTTSDFVDKTTSANVNKDAITFIEDNFAFRIFRSSSDGFIIGSDAATIATPGKLDIAPMVGKSADIGADGNFLYIGAINSLTFPTLVKISTALDADGSIIFDPGAGDNIGVECGRFNSDVVWVAGNFDGTNVIEKSEDGGTTFTVKDDATIGNVRTFVMGPDSDEKLLVFDETNGDILETKDDGTTWTSINASVTPEVNTIARLGKNTQETVFGNDGGVNNSINYSINSGDDLEDFQTGVYPNANATKVIVN